MSSVDFNWENMGKVPSGNLTQQWEITFSIGEPSINGSFSIANKLSNYHEGKSFSIDRHIHDHYSGQNLCFYVGGCYVYIYIYPLYPHQWNPSLSTSMLAAPEDSISLAASDGSADVRSAQRSLQAAWIGFVVTFPPKVAMENHGQILEKSSIKIMVLMGFNRKIIHINGWFSIATFDYQRYCQKKHGNPFLAILNTPQKPHFSRGT